MNVNETLLQPITDAPFLQVCNVDFSYQPHVPVLKNISFEMEHGELITLLGPNGAGKSTLLNCIMNLLNPQHGEVRINGEPIRHLSHRDIARLIAYVPQTVNIAFGYTVRDYVVMGRTPFIKVHAAPSRNDYALVDAALERVGISHLVNSAYDELSGGQRQLVDVARALVQGPHLILFDEPTSALDYGNQVNVLKLIKELSCEEGFGIIMTTHNPDHPILLDSSVCLIDRDGNLSKGSAKEIMTEDTLGRVYEAELMIRFVEDAQRDVCITPRF